ncbi:hypothetical protein [Bacillus sp. Bos-x628]
MIWFVRHLDIESRQGNWQNDSSYDNEDDVKNNHFAVVKDDDVMMYRFDE